MSDATLEEFDYDMHEMHKIVEWIKLHGSVSYQDDTLACGRYKDKKIRVFMDVADPWAAVMNEPNTFKNAWACYTLEKFLEVLEMNIIELDDVAQ